MMSLGFVEVARACINPILWSDTTNYSRYLTDHLFKGLDNTRFRATDEGLPHLEYSVIRGPSLKAPAKKLESEPIAPQRYRHTPGVLPKVRFSNNNFPISLYLAYYHRHNMRLTPLQAEPINTPPYTKR